MTNGTRNDLQFLSDHTNNSQLATYVKPAWASLSLVISKYSFLWLGPTVQVTERKKERRERLTLINTI